MTSQLKNRFAGGAVGTPPGINEQIAHKLHACTWPQREDRARDVLDILLLEMLGDLDDARMGLRRSGFSLSAGPTPFRPAPRFRRSGWPRSRDSERWMRQELKESSRP